MSAFQKTVVLCNKRGLHARASAKFVACVAKFDSEIEVTSHNCVGSETVVADSIMELLMLGSACGETLTIAATGTDAEAAVMSLVDLVKSGFGEDE